jgi:hypothetical protein
MFFFGGTLWLIEIIAISVAAGFVYPKGGKVQKRFATAIIVVALLNLFVTGLNPWIKGLRDSQLNPPTTEKSAEHPQQVSPAPVEEEIISKEPILPRTNNPTILKKSGEYNIPKGKYRLCFSWLGHDNGYVNQGLKIGEQEFASTESKCLLVDIISDKTNIDFINPYQTDMDTYEIISKQPGGQGVYPFLEPVK